MSHHRAWTRHLSVVLVSLAASLSGALGCAEGSEELVEEPVGVVSQAIDPAYSNLNGTCLNVKWFNGVRGRIYYPSGQGGCSTSIYSPLVVMFKGTGFSYADYDYLLNHLARNGFIAVSIDVLGADASNHAAAVAKAESYLDGMWTQWAFSPYIDPSEVGLMGHSRGGGTAIALADALQGGGDPWTVRAVAGLASVNNTMLPITKDMASAYMVLGSGGDTDQPAGVTMVLYDNASTEQSGNFTHPDIMYKAAKLFTGGGHTMFEGGGGPGNTATKGYVLSFMTAHLKYQHADWYDEYIRGDGVPGGSWPNGPVISQGSDGFLRNVIDNFEDGTAGSPTNGGSFMGQAMNASAIDLVADPDSHHRTHALQISNATAGALWRWIMPSAQDVTAYKYLSLRIGQAAGSPQNDIAVQIRNAGSWSKKRPITSYGQIAQPMEMCKSSAGGFGCLKADMSVMGTVRIPLSAFGAHNAVEDVQLVFPTDASSKVFLVDSVEFSEWIHKP